MNHTELIRAAICHTPANPFLEAGALVCHSDGALVIRHGRIAACGDYEQIRPAFPEVTVTDWRGGYLVPGLIDTHVHFPQQRIIGGLGRSLLEWLDHVALPEEARFADLTYATASAHDFVRALAAHGTTTALAFGAHFVGATAALFEAAAASGLRLVSGLVLSDRALRPDLHQTPEDAYRQSTDLIRRFHGQGRLRYAVTPRFALSTSDAMLEVCQTLLLEHPDVRLQTHVNESVAEAEAVVRHFPWARDYLGVYERYGLSGRRSVMAHSVHTSDGELERLAAAGTTVAHCPASNAALGSGLFPMQRHLAAGVPCALGTDVGGGIGFGVLKEALHAYLVQRLAPDGAALDAGRLLYLATRAGATALGLGDEIGDFSVGKAADLVYLRAPAGSVLATVLDGVASLPQALTALVTLAGSESVREVRIEGAAVHRLAPR